MAWVLICSSTWSRRARQVGAVSMFRNSAPRWIICSRVSSYSGTSCTTRPMLLATSSTPAVMAPRMAAMEAT